MTGVLGLAVGAEVYETGNMRIRLPLAMLAALAAFSVQAAEPKPGAAPAAAAATITAGEYGGRWKGEDESGGKLNLILARDAGGKWSATAVFTFQDAEVKPTVPTVRVDGDKIEVVLAWTIDGANGVSTLRGELKDGTLAGKFETKTGDGTSGGTWSVKRP